MTHAEWIKLTSKIDSTFEDEFYADVNSPELMWARIIKPMMDNMPKCTSCGKTELISDGYCNCCGAKQ